MEFAHSAELHSGSVEERGLRRHNRAIRDVHTFVVLAQAVQQVTKWVILRGGRRDLAHLESLSEAHFVGEDAVEVTAAEVHQPVEPRLLIRSHLRRQQERHLQGRSIFMHCGRYTLHTMTCICESPLWIHLQVHVKHLRLLPPQTTA
jgi:hypothetical protein